MSESNDAKPPTIPLGVTAFDEFKDRKVTDWKRVRAALEHENLLINQRFTWLLLSQGFLFTAAGAIYKSFIDVQTDTRQTHVVIRQHEALLILIPTLAVVLCVFLWRGMAAAHVQHDRLTKWWRDQFVTEKPETRHPWISGSDPTWGIQLHYHYLPLTFLLAWLSILLIGCFYMFEPYLGIIVMVSLVLAVIVSVAGLFFMLGRKGIHPGVM